MSSSPSRKRRRLSSAEPQNRDGSLAEKSSLRNISQWNLEQDYESKRRGTNRKGKDAGRLPIKTAEGRLEIPLIPEIGESKLGQADCSNFDSSKDVQLVSPGDSKTHLSESEQILEAKETLARVATLISEDPEEHASGFRTLAHFVKSSNATITKLALVSQLAVFKDVIPGYRIRPQPSDSAEKLSKDTRRLRSYEETLIRSYHGYVKELIRCAKSKPEGVPEGVKTVPAVAIACASSLLLAVPHFNFRSDLLQILIDPLSGSRDDQNFIKCCETLERLFESDDDGKPSLETVSVLFRMIKARNYHVEEAVLNTFLHLQLLSEFSYKGSHRGVDRKVTDESTQAAKKVKFKKAFRTKKQRKLMKDRKAVENDYKEADAIVGQEEREKLQSETLKIVFVTYFRILQTRSTVLMGAVLEGLAKYAHLVNQEFFGDLLEVLKDISVRAEGISMDNDSPESAMTTRSQLARYSGRSSLLCAITAFALLEGQDIRKSASDLQLDLSFFVAYLYRNLPALVTSMNLERGTLSAHARDTHQLHAKRVSKVNVQTTSALLFRVLKSILIPSAASQPPSSIPRLRVAALTKQVMMCSLQASEKPATAMIDLVTNVSKIHGRRVNGLWNTEESKGDGNFDISGERGIEGSNVFASTVWEGELLKSHFSPSVRGTVSVLDKTIIDKR